MTDYTTLKGGGGTLSDALFFFSSFGSLQSHADKGENEKKAKGAG